jgi:two-component system, chemotaxis family, response regulator Rcp1
MSSLEHKTPIQVLVLEDNPTELQLIQTALTDSHLSHQLIILSDAESALAYLRRQAPYEHVARPDLIVLDLDLANRGGHVVLAALHADPTLRGIRVLVLSASRHVKTTLRRYEMPETSLIVKSPRRDYAARMLHAVDEFWQTLLQIFEDASSPADKNGDDFGHEH